MNAVFPFHRIELKSASWKRPLLFDLGGSRLPPDCQLVDETCHTLSSLRELIPPLMKCQFSDLCIPPLCPPPADDLQSTGTAL